MDRQDKIERLALSFLKGVDVPGMRLLVGRLGGLHEFFIQNAKQISANACVEDTPGLRQVLSMRQAALADAEAECQFVEKHGITVYSVVDEDTYPRYLLQCADPPVNLFALGDADLGAERMLGVVGTRMATPYGMTATSRIVEELCAMANPTTIVSGLAYGIDKASHEAALLAGCPTVAVMAHGLDTIYPAVHRDLAVRIKKGGGAIVTEFTHGVKPHKNNFLQRNRIIAGLGLGVFVAECPVRSGALSTAAYANGYGREVFALPGRITDVNSQGCNKLINKLKASLVTSAKDIASALNWDLPKPQTPKEDTPALFESYGGTVKTVYDFLKGHQEKISVNRITVLTRLSVQDVMSAIGELEQDGHIFRHPGARVEFVP